MQILKWVSTLILVFSLKRRKTSLSWDVQSNFCQAYFSWFSKILHAGKHAHTFLCCISRPFSEMVHDCDRKAQQICLYAGQGIMANWRPLPPTFKGFVIKSKHYVLIFIWIWRLEIEFVKANVVATRNCFRFGLHTLIQGGLSIYQKVFDFLEVMVSAWYPSQGWETTL